MPDESDHILDLITGYLMGELNAGQKQELDQWIHSSVHNRRLFEQLTAPAGIKNDLLRMGGIDGQPVWDQIRRQIPGLPVQFDDNSPRRLNTRSRIWWAVAVLLVIFSGAAFWWMKPPKARAPFVKTVGECNCPTAFLPSMIDPTRVNLVLIDGAVIKLDEQRSGTQWLQDSLVITKNDQGLLYKAGKSNKAPLAAVHYNTLVTPPGKAYYLQWADGSNAWLSAGSVLRYPVPFAGNERKVELTGKAWFSVKPAKDRPFLVVAKETISVVHGTTFNVSAYPEEEGVKTTVEQGKVMVKSKNDSALVSTGEEARLTTTNSWQVSRLTNAANASSWKQGVLEFEQASLQEVLPQVAEWYAYKVHWHPGASSNERMTGWLNITDPIGNVVKAIEKNFKIRIEVDLTNKILKIY
ncbi:FecR family protein [Paraflavitalea soli]|nr:FecR domain-containing protein [Paraflavitalea soli]